MALVSNALRADPTKTTLIRRRFQVEMIRRLRALKALIIEFLITDDALGLASPQAGRPKFGGVRVGGGEENPAITQIANAQKGQYRFLTNPDKVKAFRDWLDEQIRAKVLSPKEGKNPNRPWTYEYVESAYKRGMVNAYLASRREDAITDEEFFSKGQEKFLRQSFNQPETMAKVELLATRSFEELKGITSQMGTQLNRILAQGIADGRGVADIARQMTKQIEGMSKVRATRIARTEIINAHAEGQLDSFEELGVEDLGVMAEWSTAGDDRVCPKCHAMEGKVFKVKQARGLIPMHPNCRCSWLPYVPNPKDKKKKQKKK